MSQAPVPAVPPWPRPRMSMHVISRGRTGQSHTSRFRAARCLRISDVEHDAFSIWGPLRHTKARSPGSVKFHAYKYVTGQHCYACCGNHVGALWGRALPTGWGGGSSWCESNTGTIQYWRLRAFPNTSITAYAPLYPAVHTHALNLPEHWSTL